MVQATETAPAATGTQKKPIVPFLALEDGEPYLKGTKCPKCGAHYLGARMACSKCFNTEGFEDVKLSREGEVWVYTIVYQSFPGAEVPFVGAIVDLPEHVSVRCNLKNVKADPEHVKFGMKVRMKTGPVDYKDKEGNMQTRKDREGNEVIAFWFEPVSGA
ncbi:MAG: OB-fold domain-containing protein [Dehalococcoidia bacterium]